MPTAQPSHVAIEIDAEILKRVIRELALKNPPTLIVNDRGFTNEATNASEKGGTYRGLYQPGTNTVRIASQHQSSQRERLIELTKHLKFTVLHELRHAWQRENWSAEFLFEASQGDYAEQYQEVDANTWAEYAAPKFPGLVRVKRRPVGGRTGFGRMEARAGR